MQACLKEGRWEEEWINNRILGVVRGGEGGRGLGDLVKLGVSIEEAVKEIKARAGGLKAFGERYMSSTPKVCSIVYFRGTLTESFSIAHSCLNRYTLNVKRNSVISDNPSTRSGRRHLVTDVRYEGQT